MKKASATATCSVDAFSVSVPDLMPEVNVLYVVFYGHEVLIGMVAARAFYRWLGALVDVSANEALPFDRFLTFPYRAGLDAFAHQIEAFLVVCLHRSNGAETFSYLSEAFVFGNLGGIEILLYSLFLLLGGSHFKIIGCRAYDACVDTDTIDGYTSLSEIFEEDFAVVKFICSSLVEYIGILEIAFLLCLLGIVSIA